MSKKPEKSVSSVEEIFQTLGESKAKKFIKRVVPHVDVDLSKDQLIKALQDADHFMHVSIQNYADLVVETYNGNFHR